jgi:alcohol dehydrogenase (quinone), cytochrome c subunit
MNASFRHFAFFTLIAAAVPTIGCGGGDTATVSSGEKVAQNNCLGCHDPGDGSYSGRTTTIERAGAVFPSNLSADPATGVGGWTDAQLFDAIKNGIDDEGKTLCTTMPRWGTKLSDAQITTVVAFLRTLPAVVKEIPGSTCD